jgi:hypothetical protein
MLQSQLNENRELLITHEEQLRKCDEDLKYKNEEMRTMENLLNNQNNTLKNEKETAESLLKAREDELQTERKTSRECQAKLGKEVEGLREQHRQMRDEGERQSQKTVAVQYR